MNFLAHLYIAEITTTSFTGAILGDFVRGRLDGGLDHFVEAGVRLHRQVDSFTDAHPVVRGAFRRLEPPFRRYAGILVDVYFDYLLASRWPQLHAEPLEDFTQRAGAAVHRGWPRRGAPFPARRLAGLASLLVSYRNIEGIGEALTRIDRRLSRPSPLPRALPVLQSQNEALAADFDRFFPELLWFARRRAASHARAG